MLILMTPALELLSTEIPESQASTAFSRLEKLPDEFSDEENQRWGQFIESINVARDNPFTGGGFNSWRGGQVFTSQGSEPAVYTSYPHGIIPSLLNDRGLLIGLLITLLLSIVFLRAFKCAGLMPLRSPQWGAAVFMVCLPLSGALFSGIYWTSGFLITSLTLMVIATTSTRHLLSPLAK